MKNQYTLSITPRNGKPIHTISGTLTQCVNAAMQYIRIINLTITITEITAQ